MYRSSLKLCIFLTNNFSAYVVYFLTYIFRFSIIRFIPISEIANYFEITATYRTKRSGSAPAGRSHIDTLCSYINSNEYFVDGFRKDHDKLFVISSNDIDNEKFIIKGHEYMFSKRDNEYEVRKLSNTYHSNVIFTINLSITEDRATELKMQFENRLKGL